MLDFNSQEWTLAVRASIFNRAIISNLKHFLIGTYFSDSCCFEVFIDNCIWCLDNDSNVPLVHTGHHDNHNFNQIYLLTGGSSCPVGLGGGC